MQSEAVFLIKFFLNILVLSQVHRPLENFFEINNKFNLFVRTEKINVW